MANAVRKRNASNPGNLFIAAGDVGVDAGCMASILLDNYLHPGSNSRRPAISFLPPGIIIGRKAQGIGSRRCPMAVGSAPASRIGKDITGMLKYHSRAGHNLPEIRGPQAVSEAPVNA